MKTPMQKKDKTKEIIKGFKSAIEDVRKGRYIELKSRQDMNKTLTLTSKCNNIKTPIQENEHISQLDKEIKLIALIEDEYKALGKLVYSKWFKSRRSIPYMIKVHNNITKLQRRLNK